MIKKIYFSHKRDQSSRLIFRGGGGWGGNGGVPQRHNHSNKWNSWIVRTLFKIDVWEDYIFILQYLLEKNPQGLLLTEYCCGQTTELSINRRGCYGCMTSLQHCSKITLYLYVYSFLQKWELELLLTYILQTDKDHIKSKSQRCVFYLERETFKSSCS